MMNSLFIKTLEQRGTAIRVDVLDVLSVFVSDFLGLGVKLC